MENITLRTDLAIETAEVLTKERSSKIEGVTVENTETGRDDITLSWVKITSEKGAETMSRPIGSYITLESAAIKENDAEAHERIIELLGDALAKLLDLKEDSSIMVVGLGNRNVTPDALGPKVISKILVTRHIRETLPEQIDSSVRAVSAVSPGVMGITGIETGEIIKGIARRINPDVIIAIDALAARRASRINTTIQLSDTGVSPGSGLGNMRMVLNRETMGIPVIAVGVPTVVDAATLINDTMDSLIDELMRQSKTGSEFYSMLSRLDKEEKYRLITEIADNMFVTPKEVDAVVERLANIISNAINIALHPGISPEDINRYFN